MGFDQCIYTTYIQIHCSNNIHTSINVNNQHTYTHIYTCVNITQIHGKKIHRWSVANQWRMPRVQATRGVLSKLRGVSGRSFVSKFETMRMKDYLVMLVMAYIWVVWKNRNDIILNNETRSGWDCLARFKRGLLIGLQLQQRRNFFSVRKVHPQNFRGCSKIYIYIYVDFWGVEGVYSWNLIKKLKKSIKTNKKPRKTLSNQLKSKTNISKSIKKLKNPLKTEFG